MTSVEHSRDPHRRPVEPIDHFTEMVRSVGVKKFAECMGISARQVNRILAGAQPNPVDRLLRSLQACSPEVGDRVLDYVCQEVGGYFVREEGSFNAAAVNAVRECAEAIAAISDGQVTEIDECEIREAIAALIGLSRYVGEKRREMGPGPIPIAPREE